MNFKARRCARARPHDTCERFLRRFALDVGKVARLARRLRADTPPFARKRRLSRGNAMLSRKITRGTHSRFKCCTSPCNNYIPICALGYFAIFLQRYYYDNIGPFVSSPSRPIRRSRFLATRRYSGVVCAKEDTRRDARILNPTKSGRKEGQRRWEESCRVRRRCCEVDEPPSRPRPYTRCQEVLSPVNFRRISSHGEAVSREPKRIQITARVIASENRYRRRPARYPCV